MAQLINTFLNGTAARNTNLLTTAQAEAAASLVPTTAGAIAAQTAANSIATPFNGWDQAASSAWAFGNRLTPTSGAGYYLISLTRAFGTTQNIISCFVRNPRAGDTPSSANPSTQFKLGFYGTGGVFHSHTFLWSSTNQMFETNTTVNGARGIVLPDKYADGWQRIAVAYQVGWAAVDGATEAVITDTFDPYVSCSANKNVDVWGFKLEANTGVTPPGTTADLTTFANRLRAAPYVTGLKSGVFDADGPLGFKTIRGRYHKGIYQVKSTVTGTTFSLLQRAADGAPWESAQDTVFGALNADFTKTYAIEVYPEYRLAITALADTGVQGAWLAT
jgi:hypothetical protein